MKEIGEYTKRLCDLYELHDYPPGPHQRSHALRLVTDELLQAKIIAEYITEREVTDIIGLVAIVALIDQRLDEQ